MTLSTLRGKWQEGEKNHFYPNRNWGGEQGGTMMVVRVGGFLLISLKVTTFVQKGIVDIYMVDF